MEDGTLRLSPARALAWSEAELDLDGSAADSPRIALWRPEGVTVALGLSQDPLREMEAEACRRDGVALVRRQSGGGAVLLCPGVLCWEAWATFDQVRAGEGDSGIGSSYVFCSRPVVEGLRRLGLDVFRAGVCDLSTRPDAGNGARKIAGTAQLRRRGTVLVHGSILVDADVGLLGKYLKLPGDQPEYRRGRTHRDFCATVAERLGRFGNGGDLCRDVESAVGAASAELGWRARVFPEELSPEAVRLERDKYVTDGWNWRRIRP